MTSTLPWSAPPVRKKSPLQLVALPVPLQVNAGKTVVWNGRPWKLSVEVNYYVEKSDAFGPEWMISLNIAPVVENGLATLFGSGKQ